MQSCCAAYAMHGYAQNSKECARVGQFWQWHVAIYVDSEEHIPATKKQF
jgi:hypothetical protein